MVAARRYLHVQLTVLTSNKTKGLVFFKISMSEAMFFVSLSINMHISEQILININTKRFGTYNLSYRDII